MIDFTNYFQKCISKIDKTDYLNERKINPELLKKYNVGYDDKREMVVFPINKNCYFARSVTGALNGLPNYKRLLKIVEENKYNGTFVLAFDNDKTGVMYQDIVKEELTKLKVSSFSLTLISGTEVKDLNEALIKNKDSLMKNYKYVNDNLKIIISKREEERNSEIEL